MTFYWHHCHLQFNDIQKSDKQVDGHGRRFLLYSIISITGPVCWLQGPTRLCFLISEKERQQIHRCLCLPLDRPLFRKSNRFSFPDEHSSAGGYLVNVHESVPKSRGKPSCTLAKHLYYFINTVTLFLSPLINTHSVVLSLKLSNSVFANIWHRSFSVIVAH